MTEAGAALSLLLRDFAEKQAGETVDFLEFCSFLGVYAARHTTDRDALAPFAANTREAALGELRALEEEHAAALVDAVDGLKVVVLGVTADRIKGQYEHAASNPYGILPTVNDLPPVFQSLPIPQRPAPEVFFHMLNGTFREDYPLFFIPWPNGLPALVCPTSLPVETLLDAAVTKMRAIFDKDEARQFFLKKLTMANTGREIFARNFFAMFLQSPRETFGILKATGDSYYLWQQLCFFIRQDYDKVRDLPPDAVSQLQSARLIEYVSTYYKDRAKEVLKKENAFAALGFALEEPPYFFEYQTIAAFTDSRGEPLLGQYSEEELRDYLTDQTRERQDDGVPGMFVIKTESGALYYVKKANVLPLLNRLLGDARTTLESALVTDWEGAFREYRRPPEMTEQGAFEGGLERRLRQVSPVLFALLGSTSLPLMLLEGRGRDTEKRRSALFSKTGGLLPYSEILLLSRQALLTEAKRRSPFWRVTPPFSWGAKLLFVIKKSRFFKGRAPKKAPEDGPAEPRRSPPDRQREEIRRAARGVLARLVPEGSTPERELRAYEALWNRQLNRVDRENLTADVDALARDFLRRSMRTLKGPTLDSARIRSLAETLVNLPALQAIGPRSQLLMYLQLYMADVLSGGE
ncbi:MAG: hypothetical protein LBR23_01290 [Spirochaetaceae bacterium]|jgi:hypothetical protein|nr:hypothetical protein [Spirochaetaceae bacterium]